MPDEYTAVTCCPSLGLNFKPSAEVDSVMVPSELVWRSTREGLAPDCRCVTSSG